MDDERAYRFFCGVDMVPGTILAAHPGARFVARARVGDDVGSTEPVWGVLVRLATPSADSNAAGPVAVTTDDGRRFQAIAPAGTTPRGDSAAVLAAARYWELSPAYVATLPAHEPDETDGASPA